MTNSVFSKNLRRLRLANSLTQEQLAEKLGVSVQSISRWECGNTLPDVMLLPQIARLYAVTVDDLYKEDICGYASYAQRLLAVYEFSGRSEDFLTAEHEFSKTEDPTPDDLRCWGVLYHYMTQYCARQAEKKLLEAMEHPDVTEQVYLSAAQQKIALMWELGRGEEELAKCSKALSASPNDYRLYLLYTAAHAFSDDENRALEVAREGIARFPESAALQIYAGDACRALKRYDEALRHLQTALELDDRYLDARYSIAFCHEELGQYGKAAAQWDILSEELGRRGMHIEREFTVKQSQLCRNKG